MAAEQIASVDWGFHASRASLYGSTLTLSPSGSVRLVNHLMPSGTLIQEWYSFTDYQAVRSTPDLPLLHHGKRYRIVPQIVSVPEDTYVLEVRFYDRFDESVGTEVLYPPDREFEYPHGCHHYTVRLVNGGCDEIRFESLSLLEVTDG